MTMSLLTQVETSIALLRQAEDAHRPHMGNDSPESLEVYEKFLDAWVNLKRHALKLDTADLNTCMGYDTTGDKE